MNLTVCCFILQSLKNFAVTSRRIDDQEGNSKTEDKKQIVKSGTFTFKKLEFNTIYNIIQRTK